MDKKQAVRTWMKHHFGKIGDIAYQFPAGHWFCASPESPVGKRLIETGEIYPGVKAQQWDIIRK